MFLGGRDPWRAHLSRHTSMPGWGCEFSLARHQPSRVYGEPGRGGGHRGHRWGSRAAQACVPGEGEVPGETTWVQKLTRMEGLTGSVCLY